MRHLRKFNESDQPIENKDLQETIDEVLDNLNDKGELSDSEREFMEEASRGTIKQITTPKKTGDFWADMSNPHNIGIMWIGKDNVWKRLIPLEEQKEDTDYEEDDWKKRKKTEILNFGKKMPEIIPILNDMTDKLWEFEEYKDTVRRKLESISKSKLNSDAKYIFNQKLGYALNSIGSMMDQFGPLIQNIELGDDGYQKKKSK